MKNLNADSKFNPGGIPESDIGLLTLELHTPPDSDTFTVFIQDPKHSDIYWHRSILIISDKNIFLHGNHRQDGAQYPIDVMVNFMDGFDNYPLSKEHLYFAIRNKINCREPDDYHQKMNSSVGSAVYNGGNDIQLQKLIYLIGVKYSMMRDRYLQITN